VILLGLLIIVGFWIAAPILWLIERSSRNLASPVVWSNGQAAAWPGNQVVGGPSSPAWVPPGWHPDPGGANQWRWWDGQRWTEHVSGPGPRWSG
jgi:hypothetical protein